MWTPHAWYWMNHATDGWLAVQFDSQAGDQVTLKTAEGEHYELPSSTRLSAALASSLQPQSNLLDLEELHEAAILNCLRTRYASDQIYTAISEIVISINPYKQLPIYGPNQIERYRKGLRGGADGAAPAELPPHVYAVADAAYTSLLRDESNQAILISGESGAGKTEATKLVLQYLAENQNSSSGSGSNGGAAGVGGAGGENVGEEEKIAQQILESNPILEAFGNSKTIVSCAHVSRRA
jgi:myosin heavy subunit